METPRHEVITDLTEDEHALLDAVDELVSPEIVEVPGADTSVEVAGFAMDMGAERDAYRVARFVEAFRLACRQYFTVGGEAAQVHELVVDGTDLQAAREQVFSEQLEMARDMRQAEIILALRDAQQE